MTEEEMKKQVAAAEKKAADAAAALEAAKTEHAKALTEKDAIIAQKTQDVVGARKEYKKLAEMTDAEKAAMSEKEIELQERQEAHEKTVAEFQKIQAEILAKEVGARRTAAIGRLAGKDPELAKKIEDNFTRIKDSDKAQTEEEVSKLVNDAFNMTGTPRPDPIRAVMSGGGAGDAGADSHAVGFGETAAGQELSKAMGLPIAPDGAAK